MITFPDYLVARGAFRPYSSELIDYTFNGLVGLNRKLNSVIHRNADFITGFYIDFFKRNEKTKNIKDFYKIHDSIELTIISGSFRVNIPTSYIALIYQIIKGITLDMLSDTKHSIIPVNLKELVNIPFILFTDQEVRISSIIGSSSVFDKDIRRRVDMTNLEPILFNGYSDPDNVILPYINRLPKDIWKLLMTFLDDLTWSNLKQTCKYFYFLEYENNIYERYQKYRINDSDINDFDCSLEIMYHGLSHVTKDNTMLQSFLNEFRSIRESIHYLNNESDFINSICNEPVEFIIVLIDHYEKDILDTIEYVENDKSVPVNHGPNYGEYAATQIPYVDKENIWPIVKDQQFYEKMNCPLENRYMFYPPHNYLKEVKLFLKKKITGQVTIFISYKSWLIFCKQQYFAL
ncbi:MAG: hypothetical protein Barrevirus13_18 [Barrevirus sp.]|uniref:F-box domain-containing protein n=1 Tax=Barrevirus sp. TaxID=2487763 RepID=A0A3G4ZUN1_9VIRU|nr:MAG: hypothetical protein Barrevirus13_18 [Barrevirus sp.]